LGKRNIQRPLFPTNILICFAKEICLSSPLLEELNYKLASSPLLVRAVYSSHQRYGSLIDQRLKIHVINGGKGEVE
jgi:hypothetical protein